MKLTVVEDEAALSQAGADLIASVIAARPDAALVVATGNTPMGIYSELARRAARGQLDTTRLRIFQLDAYLGLAPDDRRALYGWMLRSFVQPLGIREAQVVRLPGDTPDPQAACQAYAAAVRAAGGFDLSILGLGPNGHLGFNEPPSGPDAATRAVELTDASIESNARYWGGRDAVPARALTAGMDVILAARRSLLIVSGARKRDVLRRLVVDAPSDDLPASHLRGIAGAVLLADSAAWPPDLDVSATLSA
jgi:glucosamine-6-phosphate deaminase